MATVTVDDPVFNVISIKQFQTFQKETLVSKITRVFDKLGYYVIFVDDNDILVTKYQLSKCLVEPFEHPVLNQYEYSNQLHKYLDIIYAFYASHSDYLSQYQIQLDFIDVQIKSIKNWLASNEFYFPYLIIINEYLVCIKSQLDIDMLENIDKVKKYDSGEDQMVPHINGDVDAYKKELTVRINKYTSNIKLYNFKISNTSSPNRLSDFKVKLEQVRSDKRYLQNISSQLQSVELFIKSDVVNSMDKSDGEVDKKINDNSDINYSFLDENEYGVTPGAIGNTPGDHDSNLFSPRFSNFVNCSFIKSEIMENENDSGNENINVNINFGDVSSHSGHDNNVNMVIKKKREYKLASSPSDTPITSKFKSKIHQLQMDNRQLRYKLDFSEKRIESNQQKLVQQQDLIKQQQLDHTQWSRNLDKHPLVVQLQQEKTTLKFQLENMQIQHDNILKERKIANENEKQHYKLQFLRKVQQLKNDQLIEIERIQQEKIDVEDKLLRTETTMKLKFDQEKAILIDKYQKRIKELTKQLQYHQQLAEQYYLELQHFTEKQQHQQLNNANQNYQNPQPSQITGTGGRISRDSIPMNTGAQTQNNVDYKDADAIQANLYTDHWHDGNTTDNDTNDGNNMDKEFSNTFTNLNSYMDNHSLNRR